MSSPPMDKMADELSERLTVLGEEGFTCLLGPPPRTQVLPVAYPPQGPKPHTPDLADDLLLDSMVPWSISSIAEAVTLGRKW